MNIYIYSKSFLYYETYGIISNAINQFFYLFFQLELLSIVSVPHILPKIEEISVFSFF